MVFAPREATVLELHNIRTGADFFARLAQQLGMRYGRVTGELLPQPAVIANNRDFRIDPAVFRRVMGESIRARRRRTAPFRAADQKPELGQVRQASGRVFSTCAPRALSAIVPATADRRAGRRAR
jgi:hypothetical protein